MSDGRENEIQAPGTMADRPQLRPVEVHPHPDGDQHMVLLRDPSGLTDVALSMSLPALHILSLMDGERTRQAIRAEFLRHSGQELPLETLDNLLQNLEHAHFLEGRGFEQYYDGLVSEYLAAPTRRMNDLRNLGLGGNDVAQGLSKMFPWQRNGSPTRRIVGLIAPHLDYARGRPCYLEAYSELVNRADIRRFVILGTNHFGRSAAVVATAKDFESPLGVSRVDQAFLEQLERRCGSSLRRYEFDHRREHSVELQVLLLQHLFGADSFAIVPFLCPSPCGPTETAPFDGLGVDLGVFAGVLGQMMQEDPTPTCIVAGADLSHVGRFFGDTRPLSDEFLRRVGERDRAALEQVDLNDADGFRLQVAQDDNPTKICSAGCIYALLTALPDAKPRVLKYHQAVNHEMECTVSCAAAVFEAP